LASDMAGEMAGVTHFWNTHSFLEYTLISRIRTHFWVRVGGDYRG
jgi:hypothetical protein